MSLDVYLIMRGVQNLPNGSHIYVRENGEMKELTREEWDTLYPGREPVMTAYGSDNNEVYWANITHNVANMASHADLYEALWRPEYLGAKKAKDIIQALEHGLIMLEAFPEHYREFNPENGWGNYEGLVKFTRNYLEACKAYPEAEIEVSR